MAPGLTEGHFDPHYLFPKAWARGLDKTMTTEIPKCGLFSYKSLLAQHIDRPVW